MGQWWAASWTHKAAGNRIASWHALQASCLKSTPKPTKQAGSRP